MFAAPARSSLLRYLLRRPHPRRLLPAAPFGSAAEAPAASHAQLTRNIGVTAHIDAGKTTASAPSSPPAPHTDTVEELTLGAGERAATVLQRAKPADG
jgi:hypothetical protein